MSIECNKKILLSLVALIIIGCFFYINNFKQSNNSSSFIYDKITTNIEPIILRTKTFINVKFQRHDKYDEMIRKAATELNKNMNDRSFIGNNSFTIKNSSWVFYVEKKLHMELI